MPICEENGLRSQGAIIFAKFEVNMTIEEDVPAKLKHLSAQVAMLPQSSMAWPHGFALGGQNSWMPSAMDMSSVMDMPA